MTLTLHHGPGTGPLADALGQLLADPLDDPFADEVVVVPAKGVERWLTQRLSHHLGTGPGGSDGICAGVRFLNPRSLVALLTGTEDDDPWDPDRMVWPLLEVIDDSLAEPWCATLAWHLGHEQDDEQGLLRRDRRWSVARRLAGLFASYAVQRPTLFTDWRAGLDTDGAGDDLPPDLVWQAHLWRALVNRVPGAPPDVRHTETLRAIRDGKPLALPARLSMFGHTRLPVTELELLGAVGEVREVHLWLPQTSAGLWDALAEPTSTGTVRRREDDTARLVEHRLLASLGRDARELQRSLTVLGPRAEVVLEPPVGPEDASLLHRLQRDLRADRRSGPRPVEPGDRSVQVHSCHGPARQVEVLREVLVGLLEDDPTLEPRDVLVMCPDVEAYAPLFSAAFALGEVLDDVATAHPGHRLRVRLADRGLSGTNPLLALAGSLVHLAGGRATASEVLDLVSSEPVRHRFDLDDDQVAEVVGWVRRSGIRWGLDGGLRSAYGLDDFEENTWSRGLDRVLLGVAAAEGDAVLGGQVPLDDVGSADVDLAGRLAELVDRLRSAVVALRSARGVESWLAALRTGVAALGSVPVSLAWQEAQLDRELDEVAAAATRGGGFGGDLALADVRTMLELRLQPRPTRANFRTGHVTVCTMVPMRSVPHRVVCLVGLDDGVFPRSTVPDGDDVLQRDPMTGERDARSEDRQLLLDAVLAAQEHLVVTYTGRSVNNNQERPPAVPLDELLDALGELAPGARDVVVREHPLQSFDPRNFSTDAAAGPFSFDVRAAQAARAFQGERRRPEPFLGSPLPRREPGDVDLADLQAFFRHPVGGFLRQGLDVALPAEADETDDAVPLSLDHLEDWALGDRVLRRIIDGEKPEDVLTTELLRGDLPPRELGHARLLEVVGRVQSLQAESAEDCMPTPTTVDVTVDLGDGRRLTGVVPDVRGRRIVRVHYSKLSAKHRLQAWIDLLALSAARPDEAWTARTFGRFKRYGREGVASSLLHVEPDEALTVLRELVDVRDRGLGEPLPLFAKTSAAYAARFRKDGQGSVDADRAWRSNDRFPGEDADAAHVLVHGPGTSLDRLMALPHDDERWFDHEPTRMGQYSLRVWTPLLEHEKARNL